MKFLGPADSFTKTMKNFTALPLASLPNLSYLKEDTLLIAEVKTLQPKLYICEVSKDIGELYELIKLKRAYAILWYTAPASLFLTSDEDLDDSAELSP